MNAGDTTKALLNPDQHDVQILDDLEVISLTKTSKSKKTKKKKVKKGNNGW